MSTNEKIDHLLQEIKNLEGLVINSRNAEVYPASFFSHTFDLTHRILNELHALEEEQVEMMRKQMEERRALLQAIPKSVTLLQPEPVKVEVEQEIMRQEVVDIPTITPAPVEENVMIEHPTIEEIVNEDVTSPAENIDQPEEIPVPEIKEEIIEPPVSPGKSIEELLAEHRNAPISILEKPVVSLSEVLEKKNLSDFRKAFSLNDRFYFRRELFGGDEAKMNRVISELNEIETLEKSMEYLSCQCQVNPEEEASASFIQLLEKRFL